jgi:hypothetical protein
VLPDRWRERHVEFRILLNQANKKNKIQKRGGRQKKGSMDERKRRATQ